MIKFKTWKDYSASFEYFTLEEALSSEENDLQRLLNTNYQGLLPFSGVIDVNGNELYKGDIISDGKDNYLVEIGGYYTKESCGVGVHYTLNGDGSIFAISANPFCKEHKFKLVGNTQEDSDLLDN